MPFSPSWPALVTPAFLLGGFAPMIRSSGSQCRLSQHGQVPRGPTWKIPSESRHNPATATRLIIPLLTQPLPFVLIVVVPLADFRVVVIRAGEFVPAERARRMKAR